MTGQPIQQAAPDPVAQHIWDPCPADLDPEVAQQRYYELKRAMASSKYSKQPPQWRAVFDAEFERMRQAAGVSTVQEQQMAQQQQAQQQFQLQMKALDAKAKQGPTDMTGESELQNQQNAATAGV